MGAVVGRGAEKKKKRSIELCIDQFGPSSLEQHCQQAGWRLDFYWHRQLSEEPLASTHADVVFMFTDWFPLEFFREKQEGVRRVVSILPFVNELVVQVQEAGCHSRDLCWRDRHSAVVWRAD